MAGEGASFMHCPPGIAPASAQHGLLDFCLYRTAADIERLVARLRSLD